MIGFNSEFIIQIHNFDYFEGIVELLYFIIKKANCRGRYGYSQLWKSFLTIDCRYEDCL